MVGGCAWCVGLYTCMDNQSLRKRDPKWEGYDERNWEPAAFLSGTRRVAGETEEEVVDARASGEHVVVAVAFVSTTFT